MLRTDMPRHRRHVRSGEARAAGEHDDRVSLAEGLIVEPRAVSGHQLGGGGGGGEEGDEKQRAHVLMLPAMDLEDFLRPLYQDLDGVTRFDAVERVAAIARRLYAPRSAEDARAFEMLLLFHGLGRWLEKIGNLSRTTLAVGGLSESELRQTAASIESLGAPESDAERAIAAAILIDKAGVRGLAERL